MVSIGSLLIVIALSVLVVRIGTAALTMTGVSRDIARFQALSAFSGAGFTTAEADSVLRSAARRRIVSLLIRAGSVGAVSAISTLLLSFIGADQSATTDRLVVLAIGAGGIILLARSERFDRWITPIICHALSRTSALHLQDYAQLLHLRGDWQVSTVEANEGSWLSGKTLGELELWQEGITVLGIERASGDYVGVPSRETDLSEGDRLLLYGHQDRLQELVDRRRGDAEAHRRASKQQTSEVGAITAERADG